MECVILRVIPQQLDYGGRESAETRPCILSTESAQELKGEGIAGDLSGEMEAELRAQGGVLRDP